jgi:hypothetical protein
MFLFRGCSRQAQARGKQRRPGIGKSKSHVSNCHILGRAPSVCKLTATRGAAPVRLDSVLSWRPQVRRAHRPNQHGLNPRRVQAPKSREELALQVLSPKRVDGSSVSVPREHSENLPRADWILDVGRSAAIAMGNIQHPTSNPRRSAPRRRLTLVFRSSLGTFLARTDSR